MKWPQSGAMLQILKGGSGPQTLSGKGLGCGMQHVGNSAKAGWAGYTLGCMKGSDVDQVILVSLC